MSEQDRAEDLDPPPGPREEMAVPAWLAARRAKSSPESSSSEASSADVEFSEADPELTGDAFPSDIEFGALDEESPQAASASADAEVNEGIQFHSATSERRTDLAVDSTNSPSTPVPPTPPRRGAQRLGRNERLPPVPVVTDPQDVPESGNWLVRTFHRASVAGLLISALLHLSVLTTLGYVMFEGRRIGNAINIFGNNSEGTELSEIQVDSTLEPEGGDSAPQEFAEVPPVMEFGTSFDPAETVPSLGGIGDGSGLSEGSGTGGGSSSLAVPQVGVPSYAVQKGSFAAWTEPRDPLAGRSYEIVIQFKLPPSVKTYRGSDLSGMVIGTDGYKQAIRFSRTQTFEVRDGQVQVRIRVPGAEQLVRDTIRIESRILREKQVLEIVF